MNLQLHRNNSYNKSSSFGSGIYCTNLDYFQKIYKKLPEMPNAGNTYTGGFHKYEWLIENAVIQQPRAATLEAYNCVVLSIINPVRKLLNLYHLSPYEGTMSRLQDIKNTIFEQAKQLKADSKSPLEIFMTGGDSMSKDFPDENSNKLLNALSGTINDISEKIGMTKSIIAGRKSGEIGVSVISDATENKHYLNITERFVPTSLSGIQSDFEIQDINSKDKIHSIISHNHCPYVIYDLN